MTRLNVAFLRALDVNADPVSGGLLYVYQAGTTTPVTTYSDSDLTTAQTHPVEANSAGEFPEVYVPEGSYKVTVKNVGGLTLYEADDVEFASVTALDGRTFATAQDAIDATDLKSGQWPTIAGRLYNLVPASTYTANGDTVIDLSGSGLQAVLAPGERLTDVTALRDDTRPASWFTLDSDASIIETSKGYGYYPVSTGAHFTTAGGLGVKVRQEAAGFITEAFRDGTDVTQALKDARDAVNAEGGGTIHIPFKLGYTLTEGIEFAPSGGSGANQELPSLTAAPGVTISYTGGAGRALSWDASTSTTTTFARLRLEKFKLVNSGSGVITGVYLSGINYMSDEDLYIQDFDTNYYAEAVGGGSGGLWSLSNNITVAGGRLGIVTSAANAWTFVQPKCLSQTECGFDSASASVTLIGFSAVPGTSSSYNAIRANGRTIIIGFEFENTAGATINNFLIDVEQGWCDARSVSTRSVSSTQVIGSSTGNGTFMVEPTVQSNQSINADEFLSMYSRAIEDRGLDTSDITTAPSVGALGQARLQTKPQRIVGQTLSPGVNNSYSAYTNVWTVSQDFGVVKNVSPDIKGIKISASGLASTVGIDIRLIDAASVGGAVNQGAHIGSFSNGTTWLTYEEMMALLEYNGAVYRIVARARVPEASYSGSVSVTVVYKLD